MLLDQEYINRLSSELNKFKRSADGVYNFRCPLCGDSKKNPNLARGYLYPSKNSMAYKCHNCGESMYFSRLLKIINPSLYKEYLLDLFASEKTKKKETKKEEYNNVNLDEFKNKIKNRPEYVPSYFSGLFSIQELGMDHPAHKWLSNRMIPAKSYNDLFWTDSFKTFTNNLVPGKFKDVGEDEGRIIIPLRDEFGNNYGFQGRTIDKNNKIRYYTIIVREIGCRAYGLDKININKPILVVEGPLDSLFIDNSIAACGSDLVNLVGDGYMLDNEPRNKHIVAKYEKLILAGKKVVILPHKYTGMDINDMVLSGMDSSEIGELIGKNLYEGARAILELKKWRRC